MHQMNAYLIMSTPRTVLFTTPQSSHPCSQTHPEYRVNSVETQNPKNNTSLKLSPPRRALLCFKTDALRGTGLLHTTKLLCEERGAFLITTQNPYTYVGTCNVYACPRPATPAAEQGSSILWLLSKTLSESAEAGSELARKQQAQSSPTKPQRTTFHTIQ